MNGWRKDVAGICCVLLLARAAAAEVPLTLNYQGLILDAQGEPMAGPVTIEIGIWDSAASGARLYRERHSATPLVNGVYNITIGSGVVLDGVLDEVTFDGPNRWLELRVDNETLSPRQPFTSVAYAFRAGHAQAFDGEMLEVQGPNGSVNVVLGPDPESSNQGKVSVHDVDGTEAALMELNTTGAGIIATRGAAGSLNFIASHLSGAPDHGAWSLRDGDDAIKVIALVDSDGQGRVSVNRANGDIASTLRATQDGSGFVAAYGTASAGSLNVALTNLAGNPNNGFVGVYDANSNLQAGMYVNAQGQGEIFADVKNFVTDYPGRVGERIIYASLEGPEVAIYHRGTVRLEKGSAKIELPAHFAALASPGTITVQLTPESLESRGLGFELAGERLIRVGELGGGAGSYPVHFVVHALRRGYEDRSAVVDSAAAPGEYLRTAAVPFVSRSEDGAR